MVSLEDFNYSANLQYQSDQSKKVKIDLPDPLPVERLDVQRKRLFSVHDDVTALERLVEEREDGHESRLLTSCVAEGWLQEANLEVRDIVEDWQRLSDLKLLTFSGLSPQGLSSRSREHCRPIVLHDHCLRIAGL